MIFCISCLFYIETCMGCGMIIVFMNIVRLYVKHFNFDRKSFDYWLYHSFKYYNLSSCCIVSGLGMSNCTTSCCFFFLWVLFPLVLFSLAHVSVFPHSMSSSPEMCSLPSSSSFSMSKSARSQLSCFSTFWFFRTHS